MAKAKSTNQLTVEQKIDAITEIVEDPETMALFDPSQGARGLKSALAIASSIDKMRGFMTDDVIKKLSAGMNSELGFLTDRGPGRTITTPYSNAELREPLIQMLLLGYLPANNEINILVGKCYPAKNGLRRKCLEFPGVTNLVVNVKIPEMMSKGAKVKVHCSWMLNEVPEEIEFEFAIRLNSGMGADGAVGKAERKAYKRILEVLYGRELTEIPDNDEDVLDAEARVAAKEAIRGPKGPIKDQEPAEKLADSDDVMYVPEKYSAGFQVFAGLNDELRQAKSLAEVTVAHEKRYPLVQDNPELGMVLEAACKGREAELRAEKSQQAEAAV